MKQPTVLVTGGAGFIGSHVNKMLADAGYHTVVFDNLSHGDRRNVVRGDFVEGDLGDAEELNRLFSRYTFAAVMHFAADIDVGESVENPVKYYNNNIVNSIRLLNAMREHKTRHLIFSSSAAVYGAPQAVPVTETHPLCPLNPYGKTKMMVEQILSDYERAYGLKWTSLRYFNAAGGDPEGEIQNYMQGQSNLIPVILNSVHHGNRELTIFGNDYDTPDGTCIRDYIHIYDLGKAHITAMEQLMQGLKSDIYNLGNGKGFSVREVIEAAKRVTGKPIKATVGPRRPGDPAVLVADAAKAVKELHWAPEYPRLDTIIAHAWQALR